MNILKMGILGLAGLGWGLASAARATDVEITIDVAGAERTVVIRLDEKIAPKTSANFVKLCEEGFYDGVAFHRVIPNYIVQSGDPLTKDPKARDRWGTGGPGYTVPAETGGKHVRGAVAASRLGDKVNPDKASSGSQFYVALREIAPLDGEYTVFGTVSKGLEVFDDIAGAPADDHNVPTKSIKIVRTRVLEEGAGTPPATNLTSTPATPPTALAVMPPKADPPPTPAPAPAPAQPKSEPDPLASSRFTPQKEETMPVNVDRGTPGVPRLTADPKSLERATTAATGRDDGFVPMASVGGNSGGTRPAAPAAPPAAAPVPSTPPRTDPTPAPAATPAPVFAPEPDPLGLASSPAESTPSGAPGAQAAFPGANSPASVPVKPEKKRGPLGRLLHRIW